MWINTALTSVNQRQPTYKIIMKVAIVLLAIAGIVSASVIVNDVVGDRGLGLSGLGYSGLGYAGLGYSGLGYSAVAPWAVHNEIVQQNGGALPVAAAYSAPVVAATAYAAPIVAAVAPEAVSVNANRGSVHVAPLPGHAVSSSQLNLAPAPGTW